MRTHSHQPLSRQNPQTPRHPLPLPLSITTIAIRSSPTSPSILLLASIRSNNNNSHSRNCRSYRNKYSTVLLRAEQPHIQNSHGMCHTCSSNSLRLCSGSTTFRHSLSINVWQQYAILHIFNSIRSCFPVMNWLIILVPQRVEHRFIWTTRRSDLLRSLRSRRFKDQPLHTYRQPSLLRRQLMWLDRSNSNINTHLPHHLNE